MSSECEQISSSLASLGDQVTLLDDRIDELEAAIRGLRFPESSTIDKTARSMARQAYAEAIRAHASAEKAKIPGFKAQEQAAIAMAIATAAAAAVAALGIGQLFSLIKSVGGLAARGLKTGGQALRKANSARANAQQAVQRGYRNSSKISRNQRIADTAKKKGEGALTRTEQLFDGLNDVYDFAEDVKDVADIAIQVGKEGKLSGENAWALAGIALDRGGEAANTAGNARREARESRAAAKGSEKRAEGAARASARAQFHAGHASSVSTRADRKADEALRSKRRPGPAGRDGQDGRNGRNGTDGRNGLDGSRGLRGRDGRRGIDGRNGRDGTDGRNGIDGRNGRDGQDGSRGLRGPAGRNGIDGRNGQDGRTGRDGQDGSRGFKGRDGRNGQDGRNGRDGVDGRRGQDGRNGRKGQDGRNGRNGLNGRKGADGANGRDGRNGRDGLNGRDGTDGRNGRDGLNGQDGRKGADGANGRDGRKGVDGLNGRDGRKGQDGRNGRDGRNGDDARQKKNNADQRKDNERTRKDNDSQGKDREAEVQRVLREIEALKRAIGVKDLPLRAALTADDPESKVPRTYSNLIEVAQWQVKCLDALIGQFPRQIPFYTPDGKKKEVELKNLAHAIDETYQLLVSTADDADSAVNVGLRGIMETVHTKIVANQALDAAKANATFLGYAAQPQVKELKLSVTPAAAGSNGKLEPQEMEDFLKRSTRKYASFKCVDNQQMLPMMARILEDGEIARAALYRPLKPGLKGITGDGIKHDRKAAKVHDKRFDRFIKSAKAAGLEVKVVEQKKSRGSK